MSNWQLLGRSSSVKAGSVAGLLLALAGSAAAAEPAVLIRWQVFEYPPYYIASGPDKGKGLYDRFLRELIADLPGFSHRVETSNPTRTEALMKRGEPLCAISRLQTSERDSYSLFAQQAHLYGLPVQLIVTERAGDAATTWIHDGRLSLDGLLQARSLRIGVVANRRFGDAIDKLLDRAAQTPSPAVVRWATSSLSADTPRLMAVDRFDATLAYPSEYAQWQQTRTRFKRYPIAEAAHLIAARISCANTPAGRALIAAIDQLPPQRASLTQLQADYEALLPAEDLDNYRQLVAIERGHAK
ncbi:TIGR02285 family protein [Paucibacter sp. APW11]|uniref:TIGR02285 family protein n=1 Tax=Roseateles aquae TaxID=3077235 RepID=A0ABU3PET0_9BURK|nr:TIGR02285 family protein [Paucibacter sp. APW11]MDT9001084.1 TIGR02285 family protein [Paucibacter sp. APW11]